MKILYYSLLCMLIAAAACKKSKPLKTSCNVGSGKPITKSVSHFCSAGPLIIYKTAYDYSNNVSVLLSDDCTQVLAFPGPSDANMQRPVPLANGYYIQRMVGNVFTSITFSQYNHHGIPYTDQEFLSAVADYAPFTEYYGGCGSTDTGFLNPIIRSGKLDSVFERLN
jgi:hypothetical protein